ncbi:hypothetical protein BDV96DRAFT_379852 [Lophiotrema nucula]|uniref:Uncharacterized protein n=1 Tax=Lophiotrema nucula TaxID=690887 RepID=A0A6A5ZIQ1_9PLEO|nr:hypothetical protein BDV96DRAFT_379852 [Lophiotrema nucula]
MKLMVLLLVLSLLFGGSAVLSSSSNASGQHGVPHRRAWDPATANEDQWKKAVCKGQHLIDAIRGTNRAAAQQFTPPPPNFDVQSQFTSLADLPAWGWYDYDSNDINSMNGEFGEYGWGVEDALKGISKSDKVKKDGGKISTIWVHHGPGWQKDSDGEWVSQDVGDMTYQHNGRTYKFTNGHFHYGVNEDEGMIFSLVLNGPEYQAEGWSNDAYPDLRRASDLMYLLWKRECTKRNIELSSLSFHMTVQITNDLTKKLISSAIETQILPEWPGISFNMGPADNLNEKALALLGN